MALPNRPQGATRPSLLITWLEESTGAVTDLTGATITALILKGTTTRAATGTFTLTDAANGVFRWDLSAADVADSGRLKVQFVATYGSDPTPAKTFKADWYVEPSLVVSS